MQKTITIVALLTAGVASADVSTLGCPILSDIVYRHVAASGNGGRLIALTPAVMPKPVECRDTARAVSKGFTRAMAERNLYLTWPTPERQRGDVCNSFYLSQCYPNQDPHVPFFSLYDAAYVVQQWRAVQATVLASMPAGAASDVSRFDPASVSNSLRRSLGRAVHDQRFVD